MKVICIGTLDKFSRFFLKLGEELNSNTQTKLYIYNLHFSGFLYTLVRLKFSCWISVKSWVLAIKNKKKYLQIINNNDFYKGVDFKKLILYHSNLNSLNSTQNLLLQAIAYIDILELIIIQKSPDVIILIGDSKLSIETCVELAKIHNIKTYHIEQGPFNTTFFDTKGVNANATIRAFEMKDNMIFTDKQKKEISNFIKKSKSIKYKRSPIYRGLDFVLDFVFRKSFLFPPDLILTDTFPLLNKNKTPCDNILIAPNENIKTYLLILQLPMDVNMIYHSPYFKNHFNIVKIIHKNLPINSKLIVREHPIYKGKYEKALYEYTKKHNISFDNSISLKNSLKFSDVVIVNNSTVGIEAIAMKKTVIVLGNSFYDNPKICIKYNQHDDLKKILNNALYFKANEESVNTFLWKFLFNYLIPGFITDKELLTTKIISNKILNEHNESFN